MHRLAELSDLEPVFAIYMDATVVPFLGIRIRCPSRRFNPSFANWSRAAASLCMRFPVNWPVSTKAARHPGRAGHVGYLGSLAVAPKFQGHGVARHGHAGYRRRFASQAPSGSELIVESDNTRGLAFYERLGFEIEGTLRKFYKRSHESAWMTTSCQAF